MSELNLAVRRGAHVAWIRAAWTRRHSIAVRCVLVERVRALRALGPGPHVIMIGAPVRALPPRRVPPFTPGRTP